MVLAGKSKSEIIIQKDSDANVFAAGIKQGTVRKDVVPDDVGALVVASQMGIWGTGTSSRNPESMTQAGEVVVPIWIA
jgi:hypothetical protein